MSEKIWIDSDMHPDLFDGETPVRKEVSLDDIGLAVFKVDLTYYEPEQETHFVVAPSYAKAEDIAWERTACSDSTGMDSAEVEEVTLDTECVDFLGRSLESAGKTARDILLKHIRENGCTLTQN
jgi:hypothetical protein